MNESIESALFWVWDSLRSRQLWVQMQLAVSPASQHMLSVFQDCPCRVIHVGARCRCHHLAELAVPPCSRCPQWQCCHSVMLACFQCFQRCGTPAPPQVLCLALLGHAAEPGVGLSLQHHPLVQAALHWGSAVPHSPVIVWSLGRSLWLSLLCHSSLWLSWSAQL